MPVFFICTKFCIIVKSFLKKWSKKFCRYNMKHSQQKMETISVKILLSSDGSSAHLLSVNVKILLSFEGKSVRNVHCKHAFFSEQNLEFALNFIH